MEEAQSGIRSQRPGEHTTLIGQSAPMHELSKLLERIRSTDATVLVVGENGTGKELVARRIHAGSARAAAPFVATNCSAFNDNLLESELFGHKRGSFTGAVADKAGLFEAAHGGTFLMDEVADMSPALQVKLLRVLQEGVFLPVGGTTPKKADVRILAATNQDLARLVDEGKFRQDLYYRLNVVQLRVPPLRERREDIPDLAQHFLERINRREGRHKQLTAESLDALAAHSWPGNVRELENEIERLWVLSGEAESIGATELSPSITQSGHGDAPVDNGRRHGSSAVSALEGNQTLPEAVEALERRMIQDALDRTEGNKTHAAELLGISRRNLMRKVRVYGLGEAEE